MNILIRAGFAALGLALIYCGLAMVLVLMHHSASPYFLVALYMGMWVLLLGGVAAIIQAFAWGSE